MTRDIFAWLRPVYGELYSRGQRELALRLSTLVNHVTNDRHDIVDALVPELLAELKTVDHPWLEVFVRHWHLQSVLLRRANAAKGLDEAVYLVDLASREDTKECPQSVCAIQDLAAGYGIADGRGYAAERLAVTRETLDKIDAGWPCFDCISVEHADALIQDGRPQDALDFIREQFAAADSVGADLPELRDVEIDALIKLGMFDRALRVAKKPPPSHYGSHHQLQRRLNRARVYVRLGEFKKAASLLPDFDREIAPTPKHYELWIDVVAQAVDADVGIVNDGVLDRRLAFMAARLEAYGALRRAFDTTETRLRLALRRGRKDTALEVLADLRRRSTLLKRPFDALDRVEAAARDVSAAPLSPIPTPESPQAALRTLPDDPEMAWLLLREAQTQWPTDVNVLEALAKQASTPDQVALVLDQVHAAVRAEPNESSLQAVLARLLLAHRPEEFEAWAEKPGTQDGPLASVAVMGLGERALARSDLAAARAYFEGAVRLKSNALEPRRRLAELCERLGDLDASLQHLEALGEREIEPEKRERARWRQLVIATRLGRGATVERLANELGVRPDDGQAWAPIQVELRAPLVPGSPEGYDAERTGPATATIASPVGSNGVSRFLDKVVFDPNPAASTDGRTFAVVEILEPGDMVTFEVFGAPLPADAASALRAAVAESAGRIFIVSDDGDLEEYLSEVSNPMDTENGDGFAWVVAVPRNADLAALNEAFSVAAGAVDSHLFWLELLELMGDTEAYKQQIEAHDAWMDQEG